VKASLYIVWVIWNAVPLKHKVYMFILIWMVQMLI